MPRGGSTVILLPFCKIITGNFGLGILVSHRRKSLWTCSGSICSTRRSNEGIQLGAKWQFWKKTHKPLSIAFLAIASALGPWPWPNDIDDSFLENFISSANLSKSTAGSVPTDKTKISGVDGEESLNTWCKSAVWNYIRKIWMSINIIIA